MQISTKAKKKNIRILNTQQRQTNRKTNSNTQRSTHRRPSTNRQQETRPITLLTPRRIETTCSPVSSQPNITAKHSFYCRPLRPVKIINQLRMHVVIAFVMCIINYGHNWRELVYTAERQGKQGRTDATRTTLKMREDKETKGRKKIIKCLIRMWKGPHKRVIIYKR